MPKRDKEFLKALEHLNWIALEYIKNSMTGKNPPRDRVTVPVRDLKVMTKTNRILVRCMRLFSQNAPKEMYPDLALHMSKAVRRINREMKEKLTEPRRKGPYIMVGADATMYYHVIEWFHQRYVRIRKLFIEAATDIKKAGRDMQEIIWVVRSIINVGHPPVEKSRFIG
jgi:hypothetical protein